MHFESIWKKIRADHTNEAIDFTRNLLREARQRNFTYHTHFNTVKPAVHFTLNA